jgi:hypothetical protein
MFQLVQLKPEVGDVVAARYQNGGIYRATVRELRSDGYIFVAWTDGTAPSWVPQVSIENTNGRTAGHSLMAILVALLAGFICQQAFVPREE